MLFFICINRTHDIIYVSSCFPNKSLKHFPCNFLQIDVLYQVPPLIQSELCLYISYCNCLCVSIIQNKPTWCNIVFNTKVVIIYWYVVFKLSTSVIVSFPKLLHLIAIFLLYFLNPPRNIPTFNLNH